MWLDIPRYIKYKCSLGYKTIYNCTMSYFIVLIMTGLEVLKDPENHQTNPWPEHNPMTLNKIMLNVWIK